MATVSPRSFLISALMPGNGRVAEPGRVVVMPGNGEIAIAPVSVYHVSTTGHRRRCSGSTAPRFRIDRLTRPSR